ncbi:hypothetical protein ALNOE001_20210 [Candidatus Methanobinarius endosymbioticus]|uniref:Uncharacterized protein n=1 Tax=Candidatus Methanobinarius endosymbioticus TaxID=2006182 RepID=A0A366M7S5_9EURY|nr:hypothetical protein ALNOE001_20210 [Candidatus Methanobinarius endosymbioticus]
MIRINFTIPDSMRPTATDYPVTSFFVPIPGTYSGNTGYATDFYDGELEIPYNGRIPTDTTISIPSNIKAGQNVNITGVFHDGDPLAGISINVTINGEKFIVTTNSTGGWSLTHVPSVAGNLTVIANWPRNSPHNGFTNSNILNVSKVTTNSTINVSNGKIGKTMNITGTAIDENGNPLANVQLNVTINGATIYNNGANLIITGSNFMNNRVKKGMEEILVELYGIIWVI